jgi:hypothetical protein
VCIILVVRRADSAYVAFTPRDQANEPPSL